MPQYIKIDTAASQIDVEPSTIVEWGEQGYFGLVFLPPPINEQRVDNESFQDFLRSHVALPTAAAPLAVIRQMAERLSRNVMPGANVTSAKDAFTVFTMRPTVQRIVVGYWEEPEESYIQFRMWPGDTAAQARIYYQDVNLPRFLALRQDRSNGWDVYGILPIPHISHIQRHLVYGFEIPREERDTQEELDAYLERYLAFWKAHQAEIGQYGRTQGGENFAALFALLEQIHPLSRKGKEQFRKYFLETERQAANFTPGLYLGFSVRYSEAVDLDAQGQLIGMVRARINHAMSTWGEHL